MVCVGIDVAKDKHDCCILDSDGMVRADCFTIPNNMDGFKQLLQTIRNCTKKSDKIKVGLEATGHYSYNILGFLLDNGLPTYQFYGNITELSEKIEPLGFLRIQKSYLVNMHYVEIFQYNKVQLRGGLCLAPSEKNYNELKQKYLHWRGKSRWML